mmetsp:Transcript_25626/g.24919  ORF Transcript_25626/g.24919 Transcript_25626/m.24919 type:complete len:393 (-) Transcript_25626:124-1302(-)
MLFGADFLSEILEQINFSQPPNCVRHIAWCLYLIAKKYYNPQLHANGFSEKHHFYVQVLFQKFYELVFRDDCTQEQLICAFLGLGRVLHLHPPNEYVNNIFQTVIYTLQTNQNIMLLHASLKCMYYTVKYSKIHTSYILSLKLVPILQSFIDKAFDEKMSLLSLLTLKELAVNGFAMTFMDNLLFNSLLRVVLQGNENATYGLALDVIKAVSETSNYSIINLASYGLIRSLCYSLEQFRVYKDNSIQQIYEVQNPETIGLSSLSSSPFSSNRNSPHRGRNGDMQLFSYGLLFRVVTLLEYFVANFLQNKGALVSYFSGDCIEKFKSIIDYINADLNRLRVGDPIKIDVTEKLLKLMQSYRTKTLSLSYTSFEESPATRLVEIFASFLESLLF